MLESGGGVSASGGSAQGGCLLPGKGGIPACTEADPPEQNPLEQTPLEQTPPEQTPPGADTGRCLLRGVSALGVSAPGGLLLGEGGYLLPGGLLPGVIPACTEAEPPL